MDHNILLLSLPPSALISSNQNLMKISIKLSTSYFDPSGLTKIITHKNIRGGLRQPVPSAQTCCCTAKEASGLIQTTEGLEVFNQSVYLMTV